MFCCTGKGLSTVLVGKLASLKGKRWQTDLMKLGLQRPEAQIQGGAHSAHIEHIICMRKHSQGPHPLPR